MKNFGGSAGQAETLPTLYGLMIAFLTGLVGYVLWVSWNVEIDYLPNLFQLP